MFAVIKTGGKQYRVAGDDVLKVEKIAGQPGEIIEFNDVLVVGGESTILGSPTVAGATVAGEILEQSRGATIISFKKRRRKNSRRRRGHRQEFTLVRITEILTDGQKPSKTAQPRVKKAKPPAAVAPEAAVSATAEAGAEPEAKAKTTKKPAAKSKAKAPAAKKPTKAKAEGGKRGKAGKATGKTKK